MKKLSVMLLSVLLVFVLCSCGMSTSKIQSNLEKAGYEIKIATESEIATMNNDLKYSYGGKGTIVSVMYGFKEVIEETKNEETGEVFTEKINVSVQVVEFQDKDDLTTMYKEIRKQLDDNSKIDLSGNILVYGYESGVNAALK